MGLQHRLLLCLLCLVGAAGPETAPKQAEPASRFLESLGVNTHVAQGYDPAKYEPALRYLGVRAVRDSTGHVDRLVALHRQTGVKVDLQNAGDLPGLLAAGRALAATGGLLAFEGANEPNNFPIVYDGQRGGGTGSWAAVAAFQRDIYASVKKDAGLRGIPVFQVSEGGAAVDNVGLQFLTIPEGAGTTMPEGTRYADYANAHNYVIGNCHRYVDNQAWQAADPVLNGCWDGMVGNYGRTWRKGFPGYGAAELASVPRVTTETGWDSVANPGGESVQGKVLVNTYLAQFARGWRYTFVYELGDGEGGGANQGLFHADWSPKPAATYIHNLTRILADRGSAETAGRLAYAIADQPATVHDLLLEKSDGTFALVVWGEQVRGTQDVTVTLGGRHAVKVYDVTQGSEPVAVPGNVSRVPLTVSDHAMVVEVGP